MAPFPSGCLVISPNAQTDTKPTMNGVPTTQEYSRRHLGKKGALANQNIKPHSKGVRIGQPIIGFGGLQDYRNILHFIYMQCYILEFAIQHQSK